MPRKPQRVAAYPPQFRSLIVEAEKVPEYSFSCPKEQKITLRTMLAKYLKAIRIESEEWEAGNRLDPAPWFHGYAMWASKTSVGETPEGIRLYPRNEGKIAKLLEEILVNQGIQSTEEKIKVEGLDFMNRLLAKEKEKEWVPKSREEIDRELAGPLHRAHRLIDENGDPIKPKEQE